MGMLTRLFKETCPHCQAVLTTTQSNPLLSHIIKACPAGHYVKEFHPALETYVETSHNIQP